MLEVVERFRLTSAIAAVSALLKRQCIYLDGLIRLLDRLGPAESIREVLRLTDDPAEPIWIALRCLAEPRGFADLVPLLADPESRVRAAAARAIARLRVRDLSREVVRLLDDPRAAVRLNALYAVWSLRALEASGAVRERLGDSDAAVRAYAEFVLAELRGGASPALRRHAEELLQR